MAFAAELTDRSGQAPVIEVALAHRTGRPRPLPVRAVLAALLCLALDDRPLFLTDATRLLFCQLPPAGRQLLGVPGTATTERAFKAACRRVRYCFHAIASAADPSALPKNRRLTQDDLKARTRPMTPARAEAARSRLEAFINALLEASISVLTSEERAAYDGCTGLDATPVPLFSRGPSRRSGLCASDPDGGWYVREGDHREREDDKGKPLRKIAWALEATIATTARPPGAPPAHPDLAIGLALARPGEDPGGTGARILASAAARGHTAGWLGYDRAYTAAVPGRFQLPARALGYRPVMDYRIDQLGIQANTGGAILAEGSWYCPALPEPLITATTRLRDHAITRDLYDQQIAARRPYQLKHKDGPDADGYQRLSCPAAGARPRLMCPLRPASLSPRDGRAKVLQPPPEPPRICTQTAITIAPDTGVEHPGFGGDSILPRCSGLGGRCLPRYRRLAEPRSDHFSAFVLSNICPAALSRCPPDMAGLCPARYRRGLGYLLVGHPLCAAGSPGGARVTRSVIACDAGGALDLGGGSVAPVPRPARRYPPAATPVPACRAISEEGRGPGRSPGGCGRSPPG